MSSIILILLPLFLIIISAYNVDIFGVTGNSGNSTKINGGFFCLNSRNVEKGDIWTVFRG